MPRDRDLAATDIPSTYVPARNTIFLSLALGWAEVLDARDIVIGVNALDYSGYPDCRPEFIRAFESLAALATRAGVEGARFRVHTPLIRLTKAEIIRRGLALGLDYGLTHSCYDPAADGAPVRTLRQLRAARQGIPRSRRRRSAAPALKFAESVEVSSHAALLRQVVVTATVLMLLVLARDGVVRERDRERRGGRSRGWHDCRRPPRRSSTILRSLDAMASSLGATRRSARWTRRQRTRCSRGS